MRGTRRSRSRPVRWLAAAASIAALFAVPRAAAQSSAGDGDDDRFAVAEWSTENGLPSNGVRDIRQTADGYLWLATYEGLVRFDGVAFRAFAERDIPGLA